MSLLILTLLATLQTSLPSVIAGGADVDDGLEVYEEFYIDTPTEVSVV